MMQLLCAYFHIYPASTSLSRSAVSESVGVRTQVRHALSCFYEYESFPAVHVLHGRGAPVRDTFRRSTVRSVADGTRTYISVAHTFCSFQCILSSVIIVALKGLFMQFADVPTLWRVSKKDAV
jgi:hypothetical protein